MTKLQEKLQAELDNLLADRKKLLAEMRQVRSAILEDNPKKNKWLITITNKIEDLDRYISQHENRIQGIKQRQKTTEAKMKRRQDTKRKILLGALVEHWLKMEILDKELVKSELNEFLIRDDDKKLFNDYFN